MGPLQSTPLRGYKIIYICDLTNKLTAYVRRGLTEEYPAAANINPCPPTFEALDANGSARMGVIEADTAKAARGLVQLLVPHSGRTGGARRTRWHP